MSKAFEIQRASGYALALNEAYKTSDSYILDNQARYIVNTWNLDKDIPHSYKTNLYLVSSKTGKQGVLVTNVNQNQPQRFDWKITSAIPTIPGGLKNMAINSGEYYVRAELVNDAGEIIDFDRSQDFRITNMVSSSELIAISNREEYQKKYSVTAEFTPHIINTWDLGSSVNEEYRTDIYLLSEKTKQKGVLVTNVHPLHTQRFDWKIKKTLPTVVNGAKNMAITDGLYSILVELKDENGSIVATDQSDLFEIDQIETPKVTFTSADSYLRDYQSGVFDLESEMIINDSIFNAWNFNQIIPDEYRTQLILVSENTQERGFILGNIKPKDKQYTWKISSFLRRTINGASDLPVFSGDYRMRIEILDENGAVISFDQSPIFTITQSNDFSVSLQESSYASKYVTDIDKDIYVINKWDFGRPIPANYHTNLWLVSETSGTRGLLIQNIRYKNKRFDWKIDNYIRS